MIPVLVDGSEISTLAVRLAAGKLWLLDAQGGLRNRFLRTFLAFCIRFIALALGTDFHIFFGVFRSFDLLLESNVHPYAPFMRGRLLFFLLLRSSLLIP